ncbi:MAG: AarF/UbiB family protein [Pseudomonadota bacterium]|nr:AarF/UbiB family protein [Pseudomonadota bacterium]
MRSLLRLLKVCSIIIKHQLDQTLLNRFICPSFWIHLIKSPWKNKPMLPTSVRLKNCLIELGAIYIKFGQAISSRVDLIPTDFAHELATLQDNVPACESHEIIDIIKCALGPIESNFDYFNKKPLASASVAQVHEAVRHDGRAVVVKVLKPNIHTQIAYDIAMLNMIAKLIQWLNPKRNQLKAPQIVKQFHDTLINELNLTYEASNYSHMRRLYQHDDKCYVPKIHWDLTVPNVLVMEYIDGINIKELLKKPRDTVNLKKLAENGVILFFEQLLVHNFFHADMHPGNVFIDIKNPYHPRYMAIDFGIVGSLTESDQSYIAQNLIAFFNRDYDTVTQLHLESGWVPVTINQHNMTTAIRAVGEAIYAKPLKDISFAQLFSNLIQVARSFDMIIQPQLILLQKTLFNIEALGRQLDPDLNLWHTAQPLLEAWLSQHNESKTLNFITNLAPNTTTLFKNINKLAEKSITPSATYQHQTYKGVMIGITIALITVFVGHRYFN